ncbi:MAG: gamma-butyrobetaine hydroxylase-like domain-containing protein, partial [Alphaproteobacteria bacterium]
RLGFDDGHATGIYTWRYLRFLGENQDDLLAEYEEALGEAGLSRDA